MLKKYGCILLILALVLSVAACGQAEDPAESPTPPADDAGGEPGAFRDDYLIGYNNLGAGVWILDFYEAEARYFVEDLMGLRMQSLSANFTADQMEKDCKNLISTGVDGQLYYGSFDALTLNISDMFEEAQLPFAMPDQMPASQESMNAVLENPYFAGGVGVDAYALGYNMGERAAEMGYRKAMILAGTIGNPNHDNKVKGFTDAFTAGGGQVIGEARCNGTGEAPDKATDLFAAYGAEADCIYCGQTDFANAAIAAKDIYDVDPMIFASEGDTTTFDRIAEGSYISDGGGAVTTSLAAALLLNRLDGCSILDENGKPPIFLMVPFILDEDNVEGFQENWMEGHPLNAAVFDQLVYRRNGDVDYNTWADFIESYGYAYIMNYHA